MAKIPASVGILTCNSGATLRRALASVTDFDDIVLCDGGSTDETLEIAHEFGARVVEQDAAYRDREGRITDFGAARNQCMDAARHDWFLYIDSDESISPELQEDIARIVERNTGPQVYRVPIGIMLDGHRIRHSSNYPGYQFRFFNRAAGVRFIKPVHERIDFDPKSLSAGTLTHPWFIHTTTQDWDGYLKAGRRYRDIAVAQFAQEPWDRVLCIVVRNLRAALGVLLRAGLIYLRYGMRDAVPLTGELGRFLDPLVLSGRIVWRKLHGETASHLSSRIAYISYARMPTERAHGLQIMQTCAALVQEGKQVELIVPTRRNPLGGKDPFSYYQLSERFPITYLATPDLLFLGPVGYLASIWWFARAARKHLARHPAEVVFSRDERVLSHFISHARIIWESHTGAWNDAAKRVAEAAERTIVISQGLKEFYRDQGVPSEKLVVAHDGVDVAAFTAPLSKEEARRRLGLPVDRAIAMYVGKLDGWKGTETFFLAADQVDALCVVIGGEEKDIPRLQLRYPKVVFLGPRPYAELPQNLAAADVLVLPNTAHDEVSARFTSPLKLFAYMASGRPIVASNLPSLREVISEDMAYLVEPDNPEALAHGIGTALQDPQEALRRAARAREEVEGYSWQARARILMRALS